ncbi:hypothetical protein [Aureimonas sp. AU40]|uniref:hypothetical protein n=1 Tax=Aureimonas sp. AU40 TaxID=1637747 RepID=UPI00078233FF|nr:hypothetical protein [Aureimonas sp. AU40]
MSDPRLTDVLWIHSRLRRPPFGDIESPVVLHVVRQIAKAVATRTYPHYLEVAPQPYAYGKQYAHLAARTFAQSRVLERMSAEAAKAAVLHIPPGWDLDPIGDWIAHVERTEPEVWDAITRMSFSEIDRRQRAWHLGMQEAAQIVAAEAEVVHRYDDNGWTWQHLRTKAQRQEEGRVMQHCVGSVSFDGLEPTSGVFSLRDADGRSQATVLLHGTWIAQAYGPSNEQPSDDAILKIDELRFHLGENLSAGVCAWTGDGEFPAGWEAVQLDPMPTEETEEERARRLDF